MQPLKNATKGGDVYGQFAFAGVVAGAFSDWGFRARIDGEPWQVVVTFLSGGAFGLLGIFSSRLLVGNPPGRTAFYFVVQFLLCHVAIYASPVYGFFGILALPLASQGVFTYSWRISIPLALVMYLLGSGAIAVQFGMDGFIQSLVLSSPGYVFTIAFSFVARDAMISRERSQTLAAQLEEANQLLRAQSEQAAELATSRERNRVAREIHDGLGHYLTVINVQLEASRALFEKNSADAVDPLNKALRLSREALDEVRHSVTNLRRETKPVPLVQQLEVLCRDGCLPATCVVEGLPREMSTAVDHALFRAAQEGLTNVRKHAAGAGARLAIDFRDQSRVTLRLKDNGPGTSGNVNGHAAFGLRGMRERIELLGGEVRTASHAGEGFELTVVVPA